MRTIKINKNLIIPSKRVIEYETVTEIDGINGGVYVYEVKTLANHCLKNGDYVNLYLDNRGYRPINKKFGVTVVNPTVFNIEIPKYEVIDVENVSSQGENALLLPIYEICSDFVRDVENIIIRYGGEDIEGGVYISKTDSGIPTNEEDIASKAIMCEKSVGFVGVGVVEIKNDWHFDNDGNFNTSIIIQNHDFYLDVDIPIDNESSYKLNDEQLILNEYFEDVKASIIPEIVDNEKRQFIPVTGKEDNRFPVREIEFNLHFRDRLDLDKNDGSLRDGWNTTDEQYWNSVSLYGDDLRYNNSGYTDEFADSLDLLGFTEDDIRFNKTKIKKTFLRLMFYSSKNMLNKELLYYSTIFLDSGELYRTYNAIKSQDLEVFDSGRTDNSLRLSARFSVKNKYFSEKSSEGFYLYLFPSEVLDENTSRTIYMKVEFNHAGYGKTIPMMLPRGNNGKEDGNSPLVLTDRDFPLNFTPINKDGMVDFNFNAYQNAVMIPIEIGYDLELKNYTYRFPFLPSRQGVEKIVLNLFEPRIKG